MSKKTRSELLAEFHTGAVVTEEMFKDLFDSVYVKEDDLGDLAEDMKGKDFVQGEALQPLLGPLGDYDPNEHHPIPERLDDIESALDPNQTQDLNDRFQKIEQTLDPSQTQDLNDRFQKIEQTLDPNQTQDLSDRFRSIEQALDPGNGQDPSVRFQKIEDKVIDWDEGNLGTIAVWLTQFYDDISTFGQIPLNVRRPLP